jgi:PAS domain S-box-containing protein
MNELGVVPLLTLLDSLSSAIFIKDLSGTYTYINEAGLRILERRFEEVIGKKDCEIFDSATAARVNSYDQMVIESGEPRSFEYFTTVKEQKKVMRSTKVPIKGPSGKITHTLGIATEMSSIKNIDVLQQELTRRQTSLLDDSQETVFVLDAKNCFVYANRKALELFGLSLDEIIGKNANASFPDDLSLFSPPCDLFINDHPRTITYDVEHQSRNKVYSVRRYSSAGSRSYYVTDITERRKAEEQLKELLLRESKARAEAQLITDQINEIARHLPHMLWSYDAELGDIWTNGGWAAYTGAPAEELTGEGWIQTLHPDEQEPIRKKWREALRTRTPYSAEYRIRGKDGKYRWFQACAFPVKNESIKVTRLAGVTTNIQLLKDHEKQRANFLSLVSHELKTPLCSVQAAFELQQKLIEQNPQHASDTQGRLIDIGLKSTQRLSDLISDLLTFSRFESGQLTINPRLINLVDVLQESVISQNAMLALQSRAPLICDWTSPVFGNWDPDRLRQAFDNVIGNAIKYSSPNGKIDVSLRVEEDRAVIHVRDEGIGIATEDLRRIFMPFERAVKTSNYGGVGIGLYVTSRIIELHGGAISVESEVGHGSCFKISLPLQH